MSEPTVDHVLITHHEAVERRLDLVQQVARFMPGISTPDLCTLVEFVEDAEPRGSRTSLFLNGPMSVSFAADDVDPKTMAVVMGAGPAPAGGWGQPTYGTADDLGFTDPPNYDDLPTGGKHASKPFVCSCGTGYTAQAMLDHHIEALSELADEAHEDRTDYAAVEAAESTTSEGDVPPESVTGKDH